MLFGDDLFRRLAVFGIGAALPWFAGPIQAEPGYSDPVGYISYTIPGGAETLLPLQLAKGLSFRDYVTEVTPAGVRFAKAIPTGAFGSVGRGYLEVRIGAMAGLSIPATGFSGDFLNLERSPVGMVAVGDYASIREEQTLGELFGRPEDVPFQTGTSAETADNVSVWDARTQTSHVFYFHTGLGWREADKLNEGDKSSTPVLFPGGLIVRRKPATELQVIVQGQIIMPAAERYHPVWPGRNIISAPFTTSPTLGHYIRPTLDAPHTVTSSSSAPLSDTLRFYTYDFGTDNRPSISPVIYFGNGQWRVVGSNQDAGSTSLSLSPCLDLQRVGPAGYIRFQGVPGLDAIAPVEAPAVAPQGTEVQSVTLSKSAGGLTLRWPSEVGRVYQVKTRSVDARSWKDFQGPVSASSSTASIEFRPERNACFRVIQL